MKSSHPYQDTSTLDRLIAMNQSDDHREVERRPADRVIAARVTDLERAVIRLAQELDDLRNRHAHDPDA